MERGAGGRRDGAAAGAEGGRNATEVQFYREDVVQSVAQPALIGVVSKVGGYSDSDDSSDGEGEEEGEEERGVDDEDDEDGDVAEGSARVCWTDTNWSTLKLDDLRVIDRSFLHGDIVARACEPLGHTGTVVNVEIAVDLELAGGEVVRGLNSRGLRRVRPFTLGDYVVGESWLGRVEDVVDNVTVVFDDSAKCKVARVDPDRLVPCTEGAADESGFPFFPGQRVRAMSATLLKNARWLKGRWKVGRSEGVVVDVEVDSVLVNWIAAGNVLGESQSAAVPNEEQDAENLLPLTWLSHTNWQLGDRCLPPARPARRRTFFPSGDGHGDGARSDGDAKGGVTVDGAVSRSSKSVVDLNCWGGESCKGGGGGGGGDGAWTPHRRKGKPQQRRPVKREKEKEKEKQKKEKPVEYAASIVKTRTTVDVVWQDATESRAVDACALIPVEHLGDHDFWPEQYVVERGEAGDGGDAEPKRVGVVRSVDARQRTARVRWLKAAHGLEDSSGAEEVVSVYELAEHPDYSYCLGDVVIRLIAASASSPGGGASSVDKARKGASSRSQGVSEAEQESNDAGAPVHKQPLQNATRKRRALRPESRDLTWVGIIVGLRDGEIEVAWADGSVSKVGPQSIMVVNREIEDSSSAHSSDLEDAEDIDDTASWETVASDDDVGSGNQGEQVEHAEGVARDCEEAAGSGDGESPGGRSSSDPSVDHDDGDMATVENRSPNYGGPFKLPLAALDLVSRVASNLLGLRGVKTGADFAAGDDSLVRGKREDVVQDDVTSGQITPDPTTWSIDTPQFFDAMMKSVEPDEVDNENATSTTGSDTEDTRRSPLRDCSQDLGGNGQNNETDEGVAQDSEDSHLTETTCTTSDVMHFDCVKDSADHHFSSEQFQPINRQKWVKRMQQEWSMLEKNLPDAIYVRVYEDRMDLLTAVIVGAAGTPYHDGLFVFDLYIPPEYPSVPPVVYYYSGGLRVNPNLYENGKVCLSLLNTWTGKGPEIWNPSTSNIQQVLVSIQGLVLNEKPYFNEAGYERQVGTGEGEKNSLIYNENSFLLSCKSMLYILRRPHKHLKELICYHFQRRGQHVVLACKAYLAGAVVGSLKDSDLSGLERSFDDQSSVGFKLMLKKLVPKLSAAFKEVGANIAGA